VGFSLAAIKAFRGRPDPLVDWKPDTEAMEADERLVRGEANRMPSIWKPGTGPDVVVIVLDTVRADHLGMYGYSGETTPKLDAWSHRARVYDHMQSDAAWTLPAHGSLFTGKYPIAHGAHGVPLGTPAAASRLKAGSPTVARAFKAAGYETAGIAANKAFLDSVWGLNQGFDMWVCEEVTADKHHISYPTADRVVAMATEFLQRKRDAPLFLFVNFMDAHTPWVPRKGYVRNPDKIDRRYLPSGNLWMPTIERLMVDRETDPVAIASWREAYDGDLRFLDDQVGELLDRLPELGIDDDDYVFVLADHGEYLGEHALVEHSKDVYQDVLHVPLLIKGRGFAAGRDDTPVQTHDVASMVLKAAGLSELPDAVHTAALQVSELDWSRMRDLKNPLFAKRFNRIRRAFRLGDHKLILGSDGTAEAYDLAADPGEESPLAKPDWEDALRAAGDAWLRSQTEAPLDLPAEDAKNVEALRSLGYVE
jgi:arylsulfatase A-like enzyme